MPGYPQSARTEYDPARTDDPARTEYDPNPGAISAQFIFSEALTANSPAWKHDGDFAVKSIKVNAWGEASMACQTYDSLFCLHSNFFTLFGM